MGFRLPRFSLFLGAVSRDVASNVSSNDGAVDLGKAHALAQAQKRPDDLSLLIIIAKMNAGIDTRLINISRKSASLPVHHPGSLGHEDQTTQGKGKGEGRRREVGAKQEKVVSVVMKSACWGVRMGKQVVGGSRGPSVMGLEGNRLHDLLRPGLF